MKSTYDLADEVLCSMREALEACNRRPGIALVAAGDIVLDDCCDGVLIVRPGRSYHAVAPFPALPTPADSVYDRYIAIEMTVYLSWCIPVLNDDGTVPDQRTVDEKTRALLADAATIWGVLAEPERLAVDRHGDPKYEIALIEQEPQPNQGMCAAVETRFTLGLPYHEWCKS